MANFVRNLQGNTSCGTQGTECWKLHLSSKKMNKCDPWSSEDRTPFLFLFFFSLSLSLFAAGNNFFSGSFWVLCALVICTPPEACTTCPWLWGNDEKLSRQHSNHLFTSLEKDTGCCLTIQMPLSRSIPNHLVAKGARPRHHTRWVSGFLPVRLQPRAQWPNVERMHMEKNMQFTMLEQIFMKDWIVVAACFVLKYFMIILSGPFHVHFPVRGFQLIVFCKPKSILITFDDDDWDTV